MSNYFAKPDQTYEEHIEAVYTAWKDTIAAKRPLIKRITGIYSLSEERFIKGSLLTVVLHDIGKMTEPFQLMMQCAREGTRFDVSKNYRHELVSFNFTALAAHRLNQQEVLMQVPLEALAVAGHHKALNADLTAFEREKLASPPTFYDDGFKEALELAGNIFSWEGWDFPSLPQDLKKYDPYGSLASFFTKGIITKLLHRELPEKVRVVYLLLKGILHYADWHGSGQARVVYKIDRSPGYIIGELEKRCRSKGITFSGLRPFQQELAGSLNHVVAVAPTGSGKTEASILWAMNNAAEMESAKIIYLLPTMVTANSIWERLGQFFGYDSVGLTHSNANLLLESDDANNERDRWENRRNILFDQSFIRPVTVGTVDQLLTTGFNSGHWVLKESNAANSVIILDEIHAYDGWTLGLIISTVKHLAKLGARFLLMSATLPKSLVDLFKNELGNVEVVKEEALLQAKRSSYQVEDHTIDSAEEEIREAVKANRKVLIVVNTVDKCQELAQQFSDLQPVCYHSRFILKDRKAIEDNISSANFAIATQVVEVSLDIDFDWLFTECAPPDAVIQRAGRINRYRDSQKDSRVIIFEPSVKAEKLYNPINDSELLGRTMTAFKKAPGQMSEQDLINIVEEVYHDYKINETPEFQEAAKMYKLSQDRRMAVLDSRVDEDKQEVTRQSKYETINVIPVEFYDTVINLHPKERKWYEVKIPFWYYKKHKVMYKGLQFCDLKYDNNLGVKLEPVDV